NGPLDISISYQPGSKEVKIDDNPLERLSDLLGYLNVVIFTPDDLQLVKGSPSVRRNFINNEISQVDPVYNHRLHKYNRVLRQRNNLLKEIGSKRKKEDELLAWDIQLVELGSRIIQKRFAVLHKLNPLARLMQRKITFGQEELALDYQVDLEVNYQTPLSEIKDKFLALLERERTEELRRGITLYGPHRDDIKIESNEIDMRKYGSQGQQRTCVLALKLAELEFMKSERGEYPLLLLDDVFSELDALRREHLIKVIKDRVQTFITGTESNIIEFFPQNSKIFQVSEGRIMVEEKQRDQEG
ncbi:MAG: DNA replication/repair protein RecF, partial [Halanaerobium sp.]|nr:DNA replication/repair protein RecF [Halanaerobium sp.]